MADQRATNGAIRDDVICACGHGFLQHNKWWDIGGAESNGGPSCGMGCDHCDCDDPTRGL